MTLTSGSSFSFSTVFKLRTRKKQFIAANSIFHLISLPGCMHDFKAFILCVCWLWLNSIRSSKKSTFSSSFAPFSVSIHTAPPIMRFSELWVFPFFFLHLPPTSSSSSSQCFVYFLLFSNRRDVFSLSLCTVTQSHLKARKRLEKLLLYMWNCRLELSTRERLRFPLQNERDFLCQLESFSAWLFFLLHADEFSREEILKLSSHPAISSEKNR